jgi:hypothetical protein
VVRSSQLPVVPTAALCARIAQYCRTPTADGFTFPNVRLCDEDEAYLSDITVRLFRQVPREAVDACSELEYGVTKDFPPEVVLQRPALFQTLLSLVQTPNVAADLAVDLAAIAALTALCRSLRSSVLGYSDANLVPASYFSPVGSGSLSTMGGASPCCSAPTDVAAAYPVVPRDVASPPVGLSLAHACRCVVGEVIPLLRDARRVSLPSA